MSTFKLKIKGVIDAVPVQTYRGKYRQTKTTKSFASAGSLGE
jgi:hypothetical protein